MSPKKKRTKMSEDDSQNRKRKNENEATSSKRSHSTKNPDEELLARKRKNFVTACEQVSCKAYFDHKTRLLLLYLPPCINNSACKHQDNKGGDIKEMPSYAEEAFMIDIRSNMWYDALEVCILSATATQYLSANVLREVVEIMLNAHEDEDAECSISELIIKCQDVLMQNFGIHPPCLKKQLRQCYNNFLTSPLDIKDKTFTNRNLFGHDKGLVKYCMNRLEHEISSDSKDESIVDRYENIPEEMKQSVKGIYWQKEKFEIYEVLERTERIDRLMAVLESIIELLQFDLAIWQCRYTHNLGSHVMRSHKPLMAYVLWSNNILYTGAVNNNCRQILRIFTQLVHLQYPVRYIETITMWLNAVIQTFYICETNSNSDYPNTGKYCSAFANEFYKIISQMPQDSIIRILETIKPGYMRNFIGAIHLKKLLSTEEDCIIKNLIHFIKESKWKKFPDAGCEIQISEDMFPKPVSIKRAVRIVSKKLHEWALQEDSNDSDTVYYPKMAQLEKSEKPNCNHVVHALYLTLEAYLEAYSVREVQETLGTLNEKLEQYDDLSVSNNDFLPELNSYTVTEQFIKKYRSIFQMLKELVLLLRELKSSECFPDVLKVFEKIDLLDF